MITQLAAAPTAVLSTGGQVATGITMSGLALAVAVALLLGVRGSDFIRINEKKKAAWWGIVAGTLFEAAGGTWADIADGIGNVPTSVIDGSGLGNPGVGGSALVLVLIAFGPRWKRMIWPALAGLAAAVVAGQAGGVWAIFVNVIRLLATKIVGAVS